MADAARSHATTRAIPAFYRDQLSQSFSFGNFGRVPTQLLQWAVTGTTTNVEALRQKLTQLEPSGLPEHEQRALFLMLELIVFTNGVLQINNPRGVILAPEVIGQLKKAMLELLGLSPQLPYFENVIRLMMRLNEIDDLVGFAQSNWSLVGSSAVIRNILGFIAVVEGQHAAAMEIYQPLMNRPLSTADLPFIDLCLMYAQHGLGQWPQQPIRFDSIKTRHAHPDLTGAGMPPMQIRREVQSRDRTILIAACDEVYFYEHALPLAYSLHETNAGSLSLHLHLYSPNASVLAEIERLRERLPKLDLGYSIETVPDSYQELMPVYYSCVRFIRAHELLNHYAAPVCLIDADALLRGNWKNFCAQNAIVPTTDVTLVHRTAAPPWERALAGFLYAAPTEAGRAFLADTAAFIADNLGRRTVRWFLDQIALTAVYEAWAMDKPGSVALPMEYALDLAHRDDSFLWVVTNHKQSYASYNAYRESLAKKYGAAPHASPDYFYRTLSEQQPVYFLQIGVMDGMSFDPIFPFVKQFGWNGILIEPLPDMMERAKANHGERPGLIFENVAITEQPETRGIYRVSQESAAAAGLPHWVLGMSSFVPGKLDDYKDHVVEVPVACLPLSDVLNKHQPERIDVLQIDTEGYDFKIFRQFDFTRYRPSIINLEYVNLPAGEKKLLEEILTEKGYIFFRNDLDLFAVDRMLMFPQTESDLP